MLIYQEGLYIHMSLKIKSLNKFFGSHHAVNNLSFEIEKGTVFGLLGRNGAGKSTTIKQILGLLEPTSGLIEWDDQVLNQKKLSIGYLPEERGLYVKRKVVTQLRYFAALEKMKRSDAEKAIDKWLARLEIPDYKHKKVAELSKGNQQKIQLIASLLHDPELIILDEPFTGLDPVNAQIFIDVIKEEAARGKTIIFSSHQMTLVEELCDNVCLLKHGVAEVAGSLRAIKASYGYKNLILENHDDMVKLLEHFGLDFVEDKSKLIARIEDDSLAIQILRAVQGNGYEVSEFHLVAPSLQEIFVERIG